MDRRSETLRSNNNSIKIALDHIGDYNKHNKHSRSIIIEECDSFGSLEERGDSLSSSGSEANRRWNPSILDDLICKSIFVDSPEENLPEFFDVNRILK